MVLVMISFSMGSFGARSGNSVPGGWPSGLITALTEIMGLLSVTKMINRDKAIERGVFFMAPILLLLMNGFDLWLLRVYKRILFWARDF